MPAGVETLVKTVGGAMARAFGRPDLEWAIVPAQPGTMASTARRSQEQVAEMARVLAPQVEGILTGKKKGTTSERKSQ